MDVYESQMELLLERKKLNSLIGHCENILDDVLNFNDIIMNIVSPDKLKSMNVQLLINEDIMNTLKILYKQQIKYATERKLEIESLLK